MFILVQRTPPSLAPSLSTSPLEPNLNLFPTAIQNGHINLIIRCVIRLADERLSLDGIKSILPPLCRLPRYKIGQGVGDGAFWQRTSTGHVSRVATRRLTTVATRSVHQHHSCGRHVGLFALSLLMVAVGVYGFSWLVQQFVFFISCFIDFSCQLLGLYFLRPL